MTCRLILIEAKRVPEFWPACAPLIERAMAKGDLSRFTQVEQAAINGDAMLWAVMSGAALRAAVVTEIVNLAGGRTCMIVACGGEDMAGWLPLLGEIETHAKQNGCKRMRLMGRKGWARMLRGYRMSKVILDKDL